MKSLSKRNKIVLAIAAVVIIVVVAVVVFSQAGGEALFGTVASISISPSSSTIGVGQSETLSSNASLFSGICSWSSSNGSIVSIPSSSTNSASVIGKGIGTATITETCSRGGSGSATVTVNPPPTPTPGPMALSPANPTIRISQTITMTVINKTATCGNIMPAYSYGNITFQQVSEGVAQLTGRGVGTWPIMVMCGGWLLETNVTVIQ